MPQEITDLIVNEVSLVDFPACAEIDPRTGKRIPRARVALFKRDTSTTEHLTDKSKSEREVQGSMELVEILKSSTATREQIANAVRREALARVEKRGGSLEEAEAAVWRKHPEAALAYDKAALPVVKQAEPKMTRLTAAEIELDRRARLRIRTRGISYPQACSEELLSDTSLYDRYQRELAAGTTHAAPEPQFLDVNVDYFIKRGKEAAEDGV
jgi:hypothetical protein